MDILIYLSNDPVTIEIFHVLGDDGIPQGNIAKMYEKAKEIFRCDQLLPIAFDRCINDEFANALGKLNGIGITNDWKEEHMIGTECWHN